MPSPDLLQVLARARASLQAGCYGDAAQLLRWAQETAPCNSAVIEAIRNASALARTWLALGQAQSVVALLEPLAQRANVGVIELMLCGQALAMLGRKGDAEAILRRSLALQPNGRDATLQLAAVLVDTGKAEEAEELLRAFSAHIGAAPDVDFVLARSLLSRGQFDAAESEFRKVVQARPAHQFAQANLMELVWMRTGDVAESVRELDRALAVDPDLLALRITKARLLGSVQRPREALQEVDAGLRVAPHHPSLLTAGATLALEVDGQRSLEYARQLQAVAPSDAAGCAVLGNALLAVGDAAAALAVADALHASNPADGRALAMRGDALRMLGDDRYRDLLDYQHFVWTGSIDVPQGWTTLDDYIADLRGAVARIHTLKAHPIGNSLRRGSQIQFTPAASSEPAIRAFPEAIDSALRLYLRALGTGDDPMRRRNSGHYRLAGSWSVRLQPDGFHTNHYHPEGWISSACYLDLPSSVDRGRGEGWIQFGAPAFPTRPQLPPEYFVRPEPGLLVLFPSYMWHGTIPFSGSPGETRLTIAFDVVPST